MGRTNLKLPVRTRLAAVGTPTVTPQGTPDTDTWGYKLVGVDELGNKSAVGAEGTTATGAATLNGTDFNRITWTDVAGFVSYEIWRTTAGTSPNTTGLIGTVDADVETFDDTGLAAAAGTPNATNDTGIAETVDLAGVDGNVDVAMIGIGTGTYQLQGSYGADTWMNEGAAYTADGVLVVTKKYLKLRLQNTAHTSGTPIALVGVDQKG